MAESAAPMRQTKDGRKCKIPDMNYELFLIAPKVPNFTAQRSLLKKKNPAAYATRFLVWCFGLGSLRTRS